VFKTEACRVKGQSGRAAIVRERLAVNRAVVDSFTTERHSGLAQMNAHLVGAAGFQPAFDQRVISQLLDRTHMRDGPLARAGLRSASAPAIPSVGNQIRFDARIFRPTANYAQVAPLYVVSSKLATKIPLGQWRESENHESARLLIEPVNRPQAANLSP